MKKIIDEVKEVTFEITNRCDLRCKICGIWKEKEEKIISAEHIKNFLAYFKRPLNVSLTGGEPLLHPNFNKIYKYLYKLFLQKRLKNIDISTNAYSAKIIDFLSTNKRYLHPLTLSVSLDGMEKNHNKQRGRKNAFSCTLNNILKIKKYNVPMTLKFVITDINYKDFTKVFKLSQHLGAAFSSKPAERIRNYYHRFPTKNFEFLSEKNFPVLISSINQILKGKKRIKKNMEYFSLTCLRKNLLSGKLNFIKKCATPHKSLFVNSHCQIYNCIYQQKISSLSRWPKIDQKVQEKIISEAEKGQCPKCLSYHGYLKKINIG